MIKDRIIQVIEYKKIRKESFYENIGMTSASFRGNAKNTPLNSTAIENILTIIPDLNAEWLLTGQGDMLKSNQVDASGDNWMKDLIVSQQKTIENLSSVIANYQKKDGN